MKLSELESLKELNELDLLYKLIEKAESSKERVEEIVKGNKRAGIDARKAMQDIRLLAEIIRDEIQIRKNGEEGESKLDEAIRKEKKRLELEEEQLKKIEQKRIVQK
jgi:hypothetical protein